jgi:UDP-2,3-diacylglucosamine pyrophosphatase LpxH
LFPHLFGHAPNGELGPQGQTKWLAWLLSLVLLAVSFALGPPAGDDAFVPAWLPPLVLYGAASYLMDSAWARSTRRWPMYKRHFAIFVLLAMFIFCRGLYLYGSFGETLEWSISLLGSFMGIAARSLPFMFGGRSPDFGWVRGSNARPDSSRRLVVVADPHWCEEFTGLRQATLTMPDADWLFLGDVFNAWVGTSSFQTDANRNFLWWVSERRRTGHWVGLWMGNREFFLDGLSSKFDFIGEGVGGCLWGETFVFEHGDLINTMDRGYRFWNLISRSAPAWLLALVLPPPIGRRLASYLEKRLVSTNKAQKAIFPTNEFQSAVHGSGAPFFIAGHFHKSEVLHKGMSVEWANEGKFLVLQGGEFSYVDFNV